MNEWILMAYEVLLFPGKYWIAKILLILTLFLILSRQLKDVFMACINKWWIDFHFWTLSAIFWNFGKNVWNFTNLDQTKVQTPLELF